jgi:hypothetical protein
VFPGRSVTGIFVRAVLGFLGTAVAVIQRFGAALNLNVHIHLTSD